MSLKKLKFIKSGFSIYGSKRGLTLALRYAACTD